MGFQSGCLAGSASQNTAITDLTGTGKGRLFDNDFFQVYENCLMRR